MHQPLFIHSNPQFVSRIRGEAGPLALVTDSMEQALRWIQNPGVLISGIYLNPNDPRESALGLLETTLGLRPATPIFLIDEENEFGIDTQKQFLETIRIHGCVKNTDSFHQYISSLTIETHPLLQEIRSRITKQSEHKQYLAIPLVDFIHAKTYSFDVFLEDDQKKLCLFATAGSPIEPEYLSQASLKTSWLYVAEQEVAEAKELLRKTSKTLNVDASFPISWKSAEALFKAKTLLREMQKIGVANDDILRKTHFILGDLFQIISHLGQTHKLQRFIDQAKESDRNIACASFCILMSKVLKFEKNAILEILGLASFFQDIALYQSPFGDISELALVEMSPEIMQYYLNHSVYSADILARHTSIPEVTLQVMRQHHEKKDRTGFPHRVGGMQLHPMAEMLSLINAYLDHTTDHDRLEKEVYSHYSDRMVTAFKSLIKQQQNNSERMAA